jgi:hypothetical protein
MKGEAASLASVGSRVIAGVVFIPSAIAPTLAAWTNEFPRWQTTAVSQQRLRTAMHGPQRTRRRSVEIAIAVLTRQFSRAPGPESENGSQNLVGNLELASRRCV